MNILDFPTDRKLNKRAGSIRAIVLHTTGDTDLDDILRFYKSANGYQPNYMIETHGTIRRIVPDDTVAYHCVIKPAEQAAYARGFAYWSTQRWTSTNTVVSYGRFFPGYTGWNNKWRSRGLASPLDLVTGLHPNNVSLGIELQQPTDVQLSSDIFTNEQYQALNELPAALFPRYHVPVDDTHLLGHYDVSPMRRTTEKTLNGWDPGGKFNWGRVFAALQRPVA